MGKSGLSWRVRGYLFSTRVLNGFLALTHAAFVGFWLGVLRHSDFGELDAQYYDRQDLYRDDGYLRSGLFRWERRAIEQYFSGCHTLLLTAAGSGREVLALNEMGYQVDAFECNPRLAAYASAMLSDLGRSATVTICERDACPPLSRRYDGAVIGWASFMLIPGSHRRIQFLKEVRKALAPGAPILISFYALERAPRRLTAARTFGNIIRHLRRAELLDPGDDLAPNFAHRFTRPEIAQTLAAAGFQLAHFDSVDYGHAVGLAAGAAVPEREPEVAQR